MYNKHGLHDHNLYTIWQGIKARCYNKNEPVYHLYGGRGVTMCEDWLSNPENFIKWALENGWAKGMQIDKDIKGDGLVYSPGSCSIVTSKENNNNRRNNKIIEYKGERKTLAQWSESTGIPYHTLYNRVYIHGIDIEKAMNINMIPKGTKINHELSETIKQLHKDGKSQRSIAAQYGLHQSSISLIVNNKLVHK